MNKRDSNYLINVEGVSYQFLVVIKDLFAPYLTFICLNTFSTQEVSLQFHSSKPVCASPDILLLVNHLEFMISFMDGLEFSSLLSMLVTMALNSLLSGVARGQTKFASRISVSPMNGYDPVARTKRVTPKDQISLAGVVVRFIVRITSGAM